MALTYPQYLSAYRLQPTASSALAWLRSGQAPVGTAIPASLRQYFGGAGSLTPETPGVDWPQAVRGLSDYQLATTPVGNLPAGVITPPPVAPTPPPTPTNPNPNPGDPYLFPTPQNPYLPQMGLLVQQMLTLPQSFDPQRQALAAQAAAELGYRGLVDFTPGQSDYTTQAATTPGAGTVYGVVSGPDGRAYLQAFADTQHGFASRGVYSGSVVDAQQTEARRALDIQRQQILAQSAANQGQTIQQQGQALNQLMQNYQDYASQGAEAVIKQVAGWQVPASFTSRQEAAQAGPTVNLAAARVPGQNAAATPQPSPLTQMTGGQRTITGGLAPTTSKTAGQIGSAVPKVGRSIWNKARTRSTQLTR